MGCISVRRLCEGFGLALALLIQAVAVATVMELQRAAVGLLGWRTAACHISCQGRAGFRDKSLQKMEKGCFTWVHVGHRESDREVKRQRKYC